MRFKSLSVKEAGPLRNLQIQFGRMNLIVGNNEQGKTTLMDILIQNMIEAPSQKQKYSKAVWNKRFDFDDNIDIDVEGEPFTGESANLSSLLIIREGENQWAGRSSKADLQETEYWNESIKDIMYGNDGVYLKIGNELKKLLGVSTAASWLNKFRADLESIRSTVKTEAARVEEMKRNRDMLANLRAEIDKVDERLDGLSVSRQFAFNKNNKELIEKFFRLSTERNELQESRNRNNLGDLIRAKEDWKKVREQIGWAEQESARLSVSFEHATSNLEERKEQIEALRKNQEQRREEKRKYDYEADSAENQLIQAEKYYRKNLELLENQAAKQKPSFGLFLGALIGGILGVLWVLFIAFARYGVLPIELEIDARLEWISYVTGGLLFVVGSILVGIYIGRERQSDQIADQTEGLSREFEQNRFQLATRIESIRRMAENAQNEINRCEEDISAVMRKMKNETPDAITTNLRTAEDSLKKMKDKDYEFQQIYQSFEDLIRRIEKTEELKIRIDTNTEEFRIASAMIEKKFGTTDKTRLLEELKGLDKALKLDADELPEYVEQDFENLSREKDRLQKAITDLRSENDRIKLQVMSRIEEAVRSAGANSNPKYLDLFYSDFNSVSLNGDVYNIHGMAKELDAYIEKADRDIRISDLTSKALDKVESRVDQLIDGAVGSDRFRDTLRKVSAGKYTEAKYDLPENSKDRIEFYVERDNGEKYAFSALSTGARNQFHLALRLSLAREQFDDERGVLVLDDAFLSFDVERRRSSIRLLKEFAEDGWQIVYATVNDHSMEKLFDDEFTDDLNKIKLYE